jgi:hypothetical protein
MAATAIALTVAGGIATSSSHAAWSRPVTIASCGAGGCYDVKLATAGRTTIVAWKEGLKGALVGRRIRPDGSLGPRRVLARPAGDLSEVRGPWLAIAPSGTATVAWLDQGGLHARRVTSRGRRGRIYRIGSPDAASATDADVAVDPRGNATLVWGTALTQSSQDPLPPAPTVAHARRLSAQGGLGPTIDLTTGSMLNQNPRVAVTPSGPALVVWESCCPAVVATITIARNGALGQLGVLGPGPASGLGVSPILDLAIDRRGNAIAGWVASSGVEARRILPGGSLGPPHLLAPGANQSSPQVAVDRRANATVVWQDTRADFRGFIQSRRVGRTGSLGPLLLLSAAGSPGDGQPQVAVRPAGDATIAWIHSIDFSTDAIQARNVGPNGGRGAIPTVDVGSVRDLKVVADARGMVTAAWIAARPGPGESVRMSRLPPRRRR